jgi:hypothetical protein
VGGHPRLAGQDRLQPQRRGIPRHRVAKAEPLGVRSLDGIGQGDRHRLGDGLWEGSVGRRLRSAVGTLLVLRS